MKKRVIIGFLTSIVLAGMWTGSGKAVGTQECPNTLEITQNVDYVPKEWSALPAQRTAKKLNLFSIRVTAGHPSERGFIRGKDRQYRENGVNIEEYIYDLDGNFEHYVVCSYFNTFIALYIPVDQGARSCRVHRSSEGKPFFQFECD